MSINSSEPGFNEAGQFGPPLPERKGPMRADEKRQRHFDALSKGRAVRDVRALQINGRRLFDESA